MNKILKTLIAIIVIVCGVYFVVPWLVGKVLFNETHIEEIGISFSDVKEELAELDAVYRFKIACLNSNGKYNLYFDKGMDHLCVIRVDDAASVIKCIEETVINNKTVKSSGMHIGHIKWYYDCYGDTEYKMIFIDDYNYYVIDAPNKIVWYVQFST